MTIKSMTGFARTAGAVGSVSWHWELRSVNGRGLDTRPRVPPGFEGLEPRIREAVAKRVSRGSLTVNLNIKRTHGQTEIRLNEIALRQVLAAVETLRGAAGIGRLVDGVEHSPSRAPAAIRQRLREQVGRLMEAGATLDETRLYQEAAL